MRICIIGGTGFLGFHSTQESLRRGHQVTVVGRHPPQPADLFPSNVNVVLGDYLQMPDEDLLHLFRDHQAMILAVRMEGGGTIQAPAYDTHFRAHVMGCERLFRLAREAGVQRGVVIGSYLMHFHRLWPELDLVRHNPYVRAREEQAAVALAAGAPTMDVMILEMPYIYGVVPGQRPQWHRLIRYVQTTPLLLYTAGGTNMIAVSHASEAIVGAVEHGKGGERYTVGEANLTYVDFFQEVSQQLGQKRRVITVPTPITRTLGKGLRLYDRLRGKERGFDPDTFMRLQTRNLFFDPSPSRAALGYGQGDLMQAIHETVEACRK
jgi:dihydroflavonol-4-reductase